MARKKNHDGPGWEKEGVVGLCVLARQAGGNVGRHGPDRLKALSLGYIVQAGGGYELTIRGQDVADRALAGRQVLRHADGRPIRRKRT